MKEELYKIISHEWDELAEERYYDLTHNIDKSYSEILKPALLSSLKNCNLSSVLDIGCGVGVFTEEVANMSVQITAIDVSCKSIEIAKKNSQNYNVKYECLNIIDFKNDKIFTTIFSNMAIMTMPKIDFLFQQIKDMMAVGGHFIFTITHPAFWPIYWDYDGNGFDYSAEKEVIRDFKTRAKVYDHHQTRHYHRPLSFYLNFLSACGFALEAFVELKDKDGINWYPRFLLLKCRL